ncbi:DUF4097 family beta strand repeat-containing protein [Streptomyces hiroshimensis]|uniref:DUF4097 domain-containing protein n=1 Tax=Streptomyces hiroshimensis TaxID=66424 RepID=A0ABQ2Y916_9ACTN|nr:DUF4097 family beta strand repeat-containing protein [Streptomyces hiroshimensis]GGX72567.1 hypothetical protein GCM10010324_17360 [Streptomyces hiroshimensis]
MPAFDTPGPLSVTLEFDLGTVRVTAGKRTDTVVEVRPTDGARDVDVRAAEQTKVSCSGGKLLVKGPKKRSPFGKCGSLDVTVELPAGSDVHGDSPMADFLCEGRFGELRITTSLGDIHVDEADTVYLKTSLGAVRAGRVAGDAEVYGAGRIDLGEIAGDTKVKNANGETTVGEVSGELRANASNGRISVGVAHAGVDARTSLGDIRIGEVARGKVSLRTAAGDLDVGIRETSAAWLDVHTGVGAVRNSLGSSEGPGGSAETVEVHAGTGVGNVLIHRA